MDIERKAIIFFLLLALSACDVLHRSVYNLTSCPIEIVYSSGNMHDNKIVLQAGKSAGSIGGFYSQLKQLAVTDSSGNNHSYSSADLQLRRPAHSHEDHWGYTQAGLVFLNEEPHELPHAEEGDCRHASNHTLQSDDAAEYRH